MMKIFFTSCWWHCCCWWCRRWWWWMEACRMMMARMTRMMMMEACRMMFCFSWKSSEPLTSQTLINNTAQKKLSFDIVLLKTTWNIQRNSSCVTHSIFKINSDLWYIRKINPLPPHLRSLTAFPYVSVALNFTNWSCIEYVKYIEYIQFQDIITHVTEIDQSYYGFWEATNGSSVNSIFIKIKFTSISDTVREGIQKKSIFFRK